MPKTFYGLRFNAEQYDAFKQLAKKSGYTATRAFEKFMNACIEADVLVFPEKQGLDFEVEARVLADWLGKGKRFFRAENGEELSIQGRLINLLPKVNDAALKKEIENTLKSSVKEQSN